MIEAILQNCTVEGTTVRLPEGQLDRDVYLEIKKRLTKIGGKWKGGKVQGFVFDHDPTDLLADVADGKARNIKKEFQFFETPPDLAKRLVDMAEIGDAGLILEPSAGRGAIAKAIHDQFPNRLVNVCEIMPENQAILNRIPYARMLCQDFLTYGRSEVFNRIIANPPFSKNQDVDHIRKMYDVLAPDGILVSIASTHWKNSDNKKEKDFFAWLFDVGAETFDVPAGTFKESGTAIATVIIRIRKR